MDHRPPLGAQRSQPAQRSVSGSYALQQGLKRAPQPSRLNNVRSVSQPVNVVDFAADGQRSNVRNTAAFLQNTGAFYTSSPDAILSDEGDDIIDRPAKRAKTGGNGLRASESGVEVVELDTAHKQMPGLPLPSLPLRKNVQTSRYTARRGSRTQIDRVARRANGVDPPPIATRLPAPKNVADFHPWSGRHHEDVLTETVIKAGYFDKPPGPNSTETNSAKPTIWTNLSAKNNMGLQTLSYLFTSVIDKRQALGRCTAPSTFKPPPRVTVTDTKREAWLRDLANPEVPLRKQSRTIPHGIRGKLLMEQCLSKGIPMPRAVWLAKCVGANELRAFRRKGVSGGAAASGESKWIREWTVQIQQFLEGVIGQCGQPAWQSRMDYAVKLATSFYSERLLDKDHYLDWIVDSYAQSTLDSLPIWILLVQLYWKDITAFGRRGRRLAEATLENLHRLSTDDLSDIKPLKMRLQKLIVTMAVTNKGCLIIPKTWRRYRSLLSPKANVPDSPAQNIARRNERLMSPLVKTPQNTRSPHLQLYTLLDNTVLRLDVEKLSGQCLTILKDINTLVAALLDWSATVYRSGSKRVYLVARLIAHLHRDTHDTDSAILAYLKQPARTSITPDNIHRVLAELMLENSFSAGRYMHWLITSGALASNEKSILAIGLLARIPPGYLTPSLSNTRQTLMRRAGYDQQRSRHIDHIEEAVESTRDVWTAQPLISQASVGSLDNATNVELTHRLAKKAVERSKGSIVSLPYFCELRYVMEKFGDLQTLATVVQAALGSNDTSLLATIADTINMHAESFAAIGCLQQMVDLVSERYRALRSRQALDRTFILASTALCCRFPEMTQLVRLLENDLAICDQQNSMAVCSPASDNLVSMHTSSLDSDNDIDAVFASGNTMDEQLMQRVFSRIVQRAAKATQDSYKVCEWLNQLRAVDASSYASLAKKYITAYLRGPDDGATMVSVVSALVACGCSTFETIARLASDLKTPTAASNAVHLLTSDSVINDGLSPAEAYHFQVQQKRYCSEFAGSVMKLLSSAMEDPKLSNDSSGVLNLVMEYSVNKRESCLEAAETGSLSANLLANCGQMAEKILNPRRGTTGDEVTLDVKDIIALADPLSVEFCTGAMAHLAKAEESRGFEVKSEHRDAVIEAIANGCEVWPQLLDGAGQDTTRDIYTWVKERVLHNAVRLDASADERRELSRNLDILDVTYHTLREEDNNAQILATVGEKLKSLNETLSTMSGIMPNEMSGSLPSLHILLHLVVLYTADAEVGSDSTKQSRCNLLAALCILLGHSGLQRHHGLLEYVHDVASTVADTLPDEALASLAQSLTRSGHNSTRLSFILGSAPNPDAWVALVSHPQPAGSQQHKALMKQAANNQQQAGRMQPSPSQTPGQSFWKNASMRLDASGRPVLLAGAETKTTPFPLRVWEMIPDATPVMGDNDTSLSLSLFGARKI